MDTYVSEQETTYDLIRKIGINFKKQGKTRITKGYVQARIDTLNEYWQKFQTNHFQIVKYATSAQRKEHVYFVNDIYSVGEEEYFMIKGELSDTIDLFNKSTAVRENPQPHPQNNTSDVNKQSTQDVKLPKVILPQFSGNYEEWTSFRDLYTSLVHNKPSLSKVQKLHYLKSSVTGEAEQLLKHLQITEKNYDVAWETLDKRYNNKRMIVNTILNRFMNQKRVYNGTSKSIRELLDTTQECLNSLKNNDVKINEWDTIVIHIILNKLDEETRKQWEEEISTLPVQELPKLEKLTTFLDTRFRVLEMIPSTTYSKDRERAIVRQRSFLTSPATTTVQCSYCKQDHLNYLCKEFANLDVNNRVQHVQKERLCFNCLSSKHNVKNCKSKVSCHHCQRRHHSLLHFENQTAEERENNQQSTSKAPASNLNYTMREESTTKTSETPKLRNYLITQSHTALMATALVNIKAGHGMQVLRALIDPCSQESFISEATVRKLQLRRKTVDGLITGVGNMSTTIKSATNIEIYSRFDNNFKADCTAYIVEDVTDIMPEVPINPQKWSHLQHLSLADPTYHTPSNIDLLLGVHIYSDILMNGVIKGEPGTPIAQQTRLGYILSGGHLTNNRTREFKTMHLNITLEEMVEKFWETERLESEENDTLTPQELRAEKILSRSVDFAGPVNVRMSPGRGTKTFKAYICIFICMVTKAIHIECVSNMTMEAFMAAFRRFTSRRGFVKEMWSDHGTNFIASSKEILETWRLGKSTIPVELAALLDTEGTKWKFIPPGSPNHGGLWEAGVKSSKFHLKRTLGDTTPTFEELSTLLNQIEACLNSRPLSPLSDHPDDLEPLTPAHFLVGEPLVTIPERDLTQHKANSLSRWQNMQRMLQIFWRKWQTEFLTRLQERPKWKIRQQEFNVGDLVLIKDYRLPPSKWLLGRVLLKHPGKDNVTRVYDVRTATGVLTRSISKLCPLPDVGRKDSAVLQAGECRGQQED
ncbi:uncharacterized protein LOC125234220 [Leguminivora glycinivorella]|uniref:uncharacterized protein LOC125234220 n=1 Tax=Leguminivora glycinivorella TaxID=1035111 RepID=UPI00200FBD6F|nr:uncharacterized protein LOC125234220 [Leguminivora glycinivorella]